MEKKSAILFTEDQSVFIKNNSSVVFVDGIKYFNIPNWFVEYPSKNNAFYMIDESDLPKKVKSTLALCKKDEQIKELTELLALADNVIKWSASNPSMATDHYKSLKKSYEEKYSK